MQKIEDILTGLMIIGATIITMSIVAAGAYFIFCRVSFTPLTLVFGVGFLIMSTLRNIYIGLSIITHGKYKDVPYYGDDKS